MATDIVSLILISLCQSFQIFRNMAARRVQSPYHPCRNTTSRPDTLLPGDNIPAIGIEKSDNLKVPGRLTEAIEPFPIPSSPVVDNENRDKFVFNRFDNLRVTENRSAEILATAAAGNFLKKDEDWAPASSTLLQSSIQISAPLN